MIKPVSLVAVVFLVPGLALAAIGEELNARQEALEFEAAAALAMVAINATNTFSPQTIVARAIRDAVYADREKRGDPS